MEKKIKLNLVNNGTIKREKGQVALIVLIISSLVMTLGLSLTKKGTVETKIDINDELSRKAFDQAESAIDNYLFNQQKTYTDASGQAQVDVSQVTVDTLNQEKRFYTFANQERLLWLVEHKDNDDIDFSQEYTGSRITMKVDDSFDGAVKVDYFYKNTLGNYYVRRIGFNFAGAATVSGYTNIPAGTKSVDINTNDANTTPLLLVVTPIFSSTNFTFTSDGSDSLPLQGKDITAVGSVATDKTGIKRKVAIYQGYEMPTFFLEPVTAGGSVMAQ